MDDKKNAMITDERRCIHFKKSFTKALTRRRSKTIYSALLSRNSDCSSPPPINKKTLTIITVVLDAR
ncbi:hypothetical protein ACTXT7_007982 [Hymenolepis weldensis]